MSEVEKYKLIQMINGDILRIDVKSFENSELNSKGQFLYTYDTDGMDIIINKQHILTIVDNVYKLRKPVKNQGK